jgi:hypothetical protein
VSGSGTNVLGSIGALTLAKARERESTCERDLAETDRERASE